jgi:predicted transcriptional regulator
MKKSKDVEIKARVTRAMRKEIESIADQRGETISLVVREAISEYLTRKKHGHILTHSARNYSD